MKKILLALLLLPAAAFAGPVGNDFYNQTGIVQASQISGTITVTPCGTTGQLQYASSTTVGCSGGLTFDSPTAVLTTGGISSTANISATTFSVANRLSIIPIGSLSLAYKCQPGSGCTFFFQNNAGVNMAQISTNAPDATGGLSVGTPNTPSATLHVVGTTFLTGRVSMTTGPLHLGSPTTVPTCDATNKGNIYMNTTTNCLNYCDGSANRQVTSLAGSCT